MQEVGWDGPQREKLWRYNQHYFDDLNAKDNGARTAWHHTLLLDWLRKNAPGHGCGWEPYPTSLRIVNWMKWALGGGHLPAECVHSLAIQARWLRQRLEIHLLGNHLFANAKALVFAGLFFEGQEAQQWLHTGLRILEREVPEQILPDGGHFERSTMYHALALEDMLDLCNLQACYAGTLISNQQDNSASWRERAGQMLGWLNTMRHPDGEFSFFNDAALGIAPACEELDGYARRLGIQSPLLDSAASRWLPNSGYARLATQDAVVLLDMAPIGPDYLPGHAHADTLSFELSVSGHRVLVNSGTSCYGISAERLRQRGTAAHNTVVVAGTDSSEVWSGFRVARRARPLSPKVDVGSEPRCASGGHDGYTRLLGKPIHHRKWEMGEGYLTVEDHVSVASAPAQARFHFHPEVKFEAGGDANKSYAVLPDGRRIEWQIDTGLARLEQSSWHPRFGVSLPNTCLAVDLAQGRSRILWTWR